MASDTSGSNEGWRVDTVNVTCAKHRRVHRRQRRQVQRRQLRQRIRPVLHQRLRLRPALREHYAYGHCYRTARVTPTATATFTARPTPTARPRVTPRLRPTPLPMLGTGERLVPSRPQRCARAVGINGPPTPTPYSRRPFRHRARSDGYADGWSHALVFASAASESLAVRRQNRIHLRKH